ncbi:MAG: signal recognition particle-docking protein FtsY [Acidimicrobiales bacterium]
MEIVLGALAVLLVTGLVAAVVASRGLRRRRDDTLDPPAAPPLTPKASARPSTEAPPEPRPSRRPTPEELDRQAAEVVAEAEALLSESRAEEARAEEARAEEAEEADEVEAPPEEVVRPRFRDRLGKARALFSGYLGSVRSRAKIDEETWDELEEALVRADVGVGATGILLDDLRTRVKAEAIATPDELVEALKADLKKTLAVADRSLRFEPGSPNVWLFVGVNGVGKTTTIGKVGRQQLVAGRTVIMAAADTFRAAAAEQLELWSKRVGAQLVRGTEGGDPGAVVFDAVERAAAKGTDLVLADTAGRLHTKVNLMEELKKVRRVAEKGTGRVTEVLLVIDATTGQNGLVQARQFTEAVEVTGVVLTKLDGTAKGGIALAIQTDLGIPIKLVGLGETVDDLVDFDPDEFVEALFS